MNSWNWYFNNFYVLEFIYDLLNNLLIFTNNIKFFLLKKNLKKNRLV